MRLPAPSPGAQSGQYEPDVSSAGLAESGRQHAELKQAFHQNASAYIVAYLRYRGRDGIVRTVNTGFTRYSVVFTGERLPDGTPATASACAQRALPGRPQPCTVRPLDYDYLKSSPWRSASMNC